MSRAAPKAMSMLTSETSALREDAAALMSAYIRFDTGNPPGNEMPAALWLRDQIVARGITEDITLYEPAPGRGLVLARVHAEPARAVRPQAFGAHPPHRRGPADPARWSHPPFAGEVADGYVWAAAPWTPNARVWSPCWPCSACARKGLAFVARSSSWRCRRRDQRRPGHGLAGGKPPGRPGPRLGVDEGGSGYQGLFGAPSGEQHAGPVVFGVGVAEKRVNQLRLVATGEPGHGSMPRPMMRRAPCYVAHAACCGPARCASTR